jgi:photosynthetic reaction center cytochrome c subunit
MRLSFGTWLAVAVLAVAAVAVTLATFERPPVTTIQRGFRGTAMELVYNPRLVEVNAYLQQVPEAPEPADTEGDRAKDVYQNVQVLGDLSVGQFGRLMQYITEWVAPEILDEAGNPVPAPGNAQRGCNYCHNPENYAEDSIYTKVVARRMLQMVKHINQDWQSHVGNAAAGEGAGVTCYTCHRGNPVPANVWSQVPASAQSRGRGFAQDAASQNLATPTVGLSSLPYDIFSPYFEGTGADIRVNGETPLPEGNRHSIKQAEWTYGLMMHFSQSLNVNCTHCHNSRAFFAWDQSTPQRVNSWHGIRMVRDINNAYIDPLKPVFPANRLGPNGDPLKVNCATCHQGAYKPLNGAHMLRDYPELNLVATTPDLPLGTAKPETRAAR